MFADVRGYTDFTSQHGAEAAAELVATFTEAVAGIVEVHDGVVRGTWGDEVFAVFGSARSAVRAAVSLQDHFVAAARKTGEAPLVVGVGLDVGEVVDSGEATSGSAVNTAARLCSRAGPGEVLATRELVHLAGAIPDLAYEEHGSVHLKGVPGRTPLIRVRRSNQDKAALAELRAVVKQLPERRRARRRRRTWVVGVAVAALVLATGTWAVTRWTKVGPPTIPADAVGVLDAGSGRLDGIVTLPAGHHADAVLVSPSTVWLVDGGAGEVLRVDRSSMKVVQSIRVGANPVAAAEAAGFLWVINEGDGIVSQINEQADQQVGTVRVGKQPDAITAAFGYLWVADRADNQVTRLDPAQDKPPRTIDVGDAPAGLAVQGNDIWVTNSTDGTVSALNPANLTVSAPVRVGAGPQAILATAGSLFVANALDLTVSRVDPGTRAQTALIPVGDTPVGLAAVNGSVWVTNAGGATLTRIDDDVSRGTATWAVGSSPVAVAGDGSQLWVATRVFDAAAHRGGTLTVAISDDVFDSVDPARAYYYWSWRALRMVYDGLVGLRRSDGLAGIELVPDLAVQLPPATDNGLEYQFTLRTGIHYSDGRTVRPEDVRLGIERMFTANVEPNGGLPSYYAGILGGERCLRAQAATCDLSAGIKVDDQANTVTFVLTKPDPDFLYKLAMPFATVVPPDSPMTDFGSHPYPGTGPYMIGQFTNPGGTDGDVTRQSLTLVRNPQFRQWSSAAQPAGYPDVIRWQPVEPAAAYAGIDAGTVDLMEAATGPNQTTAQLLQQLHAKYPDRLHPDTLGFTHFIYFDTTRPPFNNVEARQGFSYAVDRAQLAAYIDDPVVTCQLVPSDFPGYDPTCMYAPNPNPLLGKQLVKQSGTGADRVHVVLQAGDEPLGHYLVSVLKQLGYRKTDLRLVAGGPGAYDAVRQNHKGGITVGTNAWAPDYPAASGYYSPILACGAGFPGWFCDHRTDSLAAAAGAAQAEDPARAQVLWQGVFHRLGELAPVVPFATDTIGILVSERANANYQAGWSTGPLLDQMWVR